MIRWKVVLEYDGSAFVGWQRQDNGMSVQQALEEAIEAFAGERVAVVGAGRTDAGVHACAQVAHVDLSRDWPAKTVRDATNHHLRERRHGSRLAVLSAEPVDAAFHARFSATSRRYLYRIVNRRAPLVLESGRAWWVPAPLDAAAMAKGATHLVGKHDFTSFRASECQADSPVKTLDRLEVRREEEKLRIEAGARSFLHHQVRNIVGTLKLVGEGKWSPDDVAGALAARDRRAAGPTAPACGLYLVDVRYDD